MIPSCSHLCATHAVIGRDTDGDGGVIGWYSDEITAHRSLRELRNSGGEGQVVLVIDGELLPADKTMVDKMIFEQMLED